MELTPTNVSTRDVSSVMEKLGTQGLITNLNHGQQWLVLLFFNSLDRLWDQLYVQKLIPGLYTHTWLGERTTNTQCKYNTD